MLSTVQNRAFFRLRQINSRRPRYRSKQIQGGGLLRVNNYETTNAFIWRFGTWEPGLTNYLLRNVRSGDKFIDIGANIGYYSVLAASLGAKPIAFEPLPSVLKQLRQNFELNGIDVSGIKPYAIGAECRTAMIYEGPTLNRGRSSVAGPPVKQSSDSAKFEINVRPLEFFSDDLRNAKFIKIDVEGLETEVLKSVLENLEVFDPALTILVEIREDEKDRPAAGSIETIMSRFRQAGFAFRVVENRYDLTFYRRAISGNYREWTPETVDDLIELMQERGMIDLILSRQNV
ncbi:MAG: FkbM family methyltransferase [Betaproteobacteria bacterium]|nr:MAG: FkbM family methyltransferase [Betaproteobacteria bacterium]